MILLMHSPPLYKVERGLGGEYMSQRSKDPYNVGKERHNEQH